MNNIYKKHVFIINDIVEFDPQRNELKTLMSDTNIITLNVPVSRCLELLLINYNKVITQSDFFHDVWERNGTYVTLGTFYQNISLLRKGLKNIGLGDNIIATIPRKGLSITNETKIEKKILTDAIQDSSHEIISESNSNKTENTMIIKTTITYAILFIMGISPLSTVNFHNKIDVPTYSLLSNNSYCNTYFFGITDKSRVLHALDSLKLDCSKLKYVYVYVHPYLNEMSIIQCDHPFDRTSQINCSTKNKIGDINEL